MLVLKVSVILTQDVSVPNLRTKAENLMAQMSEELIEQWADATAEIYNESLPV